MTRSYAWGLLLDHLYNALSEAAGTTPSVGPVVLECEYYRPHLAHIQAVIGGHQFSVSMLDGGDPTQQEV